jgi:hypothetical protein
MGAGGSGGRDSHSPRGPDRPAGTAAWPDAGRIRRRVAAARRAASGRGRSDPGRAAEAPARATARTCHPRAGRGAGRRACNRRRLLPCAGARTASGRPPRDRPGPGSPDAREPAPPSSVAARRDAAPPARPRSSPGTPPGSRPRTGSCTCNGACPGTCTCIGACPGARARRSAGTALAGARRHDHDRRARRTLRRRKRPRLRSRARPRRRRPRKPQRRPGPRPGAR